MMAVEWASDRVEGGLHTATAKATTACGPMHLVVEELGEAGWDWHVWDAAGRGQHYRVVDTLEDAKAAAEQALDMLVRELGLPAGPGSAPV